jgi:hypothetical protein
METKEIEILKGINSEDLYVPVMWPEIQYLMELEGFQDNSYLINDDRGMDDFGSSAYMINFKWLVENGWY